MKEALFFTILLMTVEGVGHLKAMSRDENEEDSSLLYATHSNCQSQMLRKPT